jgi:CheY-like chemotaxis protein
MTHLSVSILAVDDDPALLQLLKQYLTGLGHVLAACGSAQEALALFRANPQGYSLVLVDLTMPDMSGRELLFELLNLNPGLRVLLLSGYPFDVSGLPEQVRPQVGFLQKPFLPKALAEAIQKLVGDR